MPDAFWNDETIQSAIASRHFGRLIKAWRTHPHHGRVISQTQAAAWLATTQSQLSRIEGGPASMQLDRLTFWAATIRVPARLLWFSVDVAGSSPSIERQEVAGTAGQPADALWLPDATGWAPERIAGVLEELTTEEFTMNRREATRRLLGMALGPILLDRLEPWLAPGLTHVVDARRTTIGLEEIEQLEQTAVAFRAWDHQFGGGLRRKAVIGQLNELAAEARHGSHPPSIRQRLFGVMAELAECAATMSWDSGDGVAAQRYYVAALQAAREANDPEFGANILAGMARQLYYLDRPGDGLELVRLAQEGLRGGGSPQVRSMLAVREAWGYAKQGRQAAFRRLTSTAEDQLRDADRAVEPAHWIAYFDEAELAGTTGGRLLELAHTDPTLAGETGDLIAQAVQLRSGGLRSSALDHIGLAEARLVQRELDEAVRFGHAALDVAEQTQSDRVREKLMGFRAATESYAAAPTVIDLRERMHDLLGATA